MGLLMLGIIFNFRGGRHHGYSGRLFNFNEWKLWKIDKDYGPGAPASINARTLIKAKDSLLVDDVDSHFPYRSHPFSLENGD